ncbi:hypothetical protein [Velocimicrobium porci]|uniref:Uncharacterized protein n=1 Tax=Velocimicrobium porci TaxID=2606634 RepID=A0A6L5XXJ3_9FIRM|nr:hypothetical protein [Velocimicrobium porci]MSS63191.1 hypothetical protein [Velocimicrobium porci]
MPVNIHFNRNPGGYELANNLETEIAGVAALDAVQGKKLNDKINEALGAQALEHFTKFPSDMWKGRITYHRIFGSVQGEYDPLPGDHRCYHYNAITYGEAKRCTQIAIQAYYSESKDIYPNGYDKKGFYIRTQHDDLVSKWTRIMTSDDREVLKPQEVLQLQNGFEFWGDSTYGVIGRTGNLVHINFLLKGGTGTPGGIICELPYIPLSNEIHCLSFGDKIFEIRTLKDGIIKLEGGLPSEDTSTCYCIECNYICV